MANAAAASSDKDRGHVPEETWDVALAQQAQRDAAFQRKLEGKRPFPKGIGPSKLVPLELEGTDRVFVILAEFGDQRHPSYCDAVAVQPPARSPAPSPPTGRRSGTTARCTTRSLLPTGPSTTPRCGRPTTTARTTRTCTSTG